MVLRPVAADDRRQSGYILWPEGGDIGDAAAASEEGVGEDDGIVGFDEDAGVAEIRDCPTDV